MGTFVDLVDSPRDKATQAIGEEIAELAAHIHAATCRMLKLLYEFDRNEGWQGWLTCAQWLSWRTGVGLDAAREKVRVARVLPELPKITAAFEAGQISYSKVRAMTRIATVDTEELLLQIAIHGTASHVERVVRGYRRADPEREIARSNLRHEGRHLEARQDREGNVVIEGKLPPELGARVLKALDAAADALYQGEEEGTERGTYGQRRADALVLVADTALAGKMCGRRAADTHQIVVHVDAEVLADPNADGRSDLETGGGLSAESSRRLACDASVVTVLEDAEGNPLSVGRRRRTVPPSIRRALENREPGCQFPGCHHTRFLEAHHIHHWADGGETKLENLAHLCSAHHRKLHEGGFRIEREGDGPLRFVSEAGIAWGDAPPLPRAASVDRLMHVQEDLGIDADRLPLWAGHPMDYGFTVSALLLADGRELPGRRLSAATEGEPV